MWPRLLFLQTGLAVVFGVLLFAPAIVALLFPSNVEDILRFFLTGLLTEETSDWGSFPVWLANYAFLCGLIVSAVADENSVTPTTIADNILPEDTSPLVNVIRLVIRVAFDQGRAQRFVWPPTLASSPSASRFLAQTSHVSDLIRRVRPVTTFTLGLPFLMFLFVVTVRRPLRVLRHRISTVAIKPLTARAAHQMVVLGSQLHLYLQDGVFLLYRFAQMAADRIIDTLAPFFFGVTMVVTTAIGILLYGIGHVSVAAMVESGRYGLNSEAAETANELIWTQWRLLRQIDWSWWCSATWRWQKRREERHRRLDSHTNSGSESDDDDHGHHRSRSHHRHQRDHSETHDRHRSQSRSDSRRSWFWRIFAAVRQMRAFRSKTSDHEDAPQPPEAEVGEPKEQLFHRRVQKSSILTQADGVDAETQTDFTGASKNCGMAAHLPTPATPPSSEPGEIAPCMSSKRWQTIVEDEAEAEAREVSEVESQQSTYTST